MDRDLARVQTTESKVEGMENQLQNIYDNLVQKIQQLNRDLRFLIDQRDFGVEFNQKEAEIRRLKMELAQIEKDRYKVTKPLPLLFPMIPIARWNVRGLNHRDHQEAVCDLIREFGVKFIGLLETRVAITNVMQIQSVMLSGWNWFVDPTGPGNRIWLAWDATEIVVDILSVHVQCIHCRVHSLRSRVDSLVTIVYGLNDVISRRELWTHLVSVMEDVGENPWIVLGDFNAVLDHSEVCGHSGDINASMGDFRALLIDTGLVPLPSQGAFFTWYNCSDGPRSLWKKLDRMLVNDSWLTRWLNTSCLCATPRTSNHSPLILRGYESRNSRCLFRFDNYLAKSSGFIDIVRGVWEHPIYGTPMYSVTRKLKALKPNFWLLRKEKGDLMANVNQAMLFLETIQRLLDTDHSNKLLFLIERVARLVVLKATKLEQSMLQ
ncbi:UNVERIFIED_CONTAM: hypothetical protein Slati_0888900 [Sesamum latifolium]|uniref:Endonuclease/exonuclease/phosphatase domain-containing protein n=1 Tax=Sesamum latifolium TaxID=2727402 RepID=A0AAW2XN67_9LAMI